MRRTQTVPATEYEEVDEAPRRRIGMWILILLLLAGIGVMAWLLTSGKLDNKGSAVKVAVPSVLNMKSADAKATLEQQGFVVNLTFEQRDDVDTDIVFSQNPDGDTQADKGSTVDIIASSGGEPVELPNVIGLQQADAVAKLQGINMQTEHRHECRPRTSPKARCWPRTRRRARRCPSRQSSPCRSRARLTSSRSRT